MGTKVSLFMFNAWVAGIIATSIALYFGNPIMKAIHFVMFHPTVRGTWWLEISIVNVIVTMIPLMVGIPILLFINWMSITADSLEPKDGVPKDGGSRHRCPECPDIKQYGFAACEGCCGR